MKLPFTVQQFFELFTRCNEAVWPMQLVLTMLALAIIVLLFRPRHYSNRVIVAGLSFFRAWMAIAYHFAFFTAIPRLGIP